METADFSHAQTEQFSPSHPQGMTTLSFSVESAGEPAEQLALTAATALVTPIEFSDPTSLPTSLRPDFHPATDPFTHPEFVEN